MITAMILAGGVGSRVGAERPKQFVEVCGKPILAYTIEIYQKNPQVEAIEIVCHADWIDYLKEMIDVYDSVRIHYGAAPFSSQQIVTDGIKVCQEHGMSVSCTPCFQLMGSDDGNGESKRWINRDKQVQICCPQSFKYGYLADIYKRAEEKGLLETVEPHTTSLMYALGDTIYQSYGNQTNIKITTKEDLELFEGYVLLQEKRERTQ